MTTQISIQEQKLLQANIRKFYAYKVLSGMFFAVPVIVLFWQQNGLSLTEVMIVQSLYAIAVVLLEVPSGYFADLFGRKKTLIIGGVFGILGMYFLGIGTNIWYFLVAELFFAFFSSSVSGTGSAFLYDSLQDLGKKDEYKKIWGNSIFYFLLGLAFANIFGGIVANYDMRLAIFMSIPFFVVMIGIAMSMYEPHRHKVILKKGYVKELFSIIKTRVIGSHRLKWLLIYSGLIFGFNQAVLWFYQPYFDISGLDIFYFGFIFASFQIVAGISSKYAHALEEKLGEKYSLVMLIFLVAGSYLLMSNFVYRFSFVFCFIQQFVRGFKDVVFNDYMNKLTTSDIRATVLSVDGLFRQLFYASLIPFFGYIADVYSLEQALMVMGISGTISGIVIVGLLKYNKVI